MSFLYQNRTIIIVATKDTIATGKAHIMKSSNDNFPLIAIKIPMGFPKTVPELPILVAMTQEIT
ncbi:MAG: hypothetical protein AMQ22_02199 [Candidatus Methanofastidiosum methylothiophilum]|uniref:Uncharacterized protein n=1 Tax=Candidatus Methanofastidiosum methylothiophilum TaxID=1705564 RepID=A0A150IKS8_9EURY|nr:MAG: hypothetical protein AMQ22_02199 [Candidatus Methanofastidiosum methylthiophilus]